VKLSYYVFLFPFTNLSSFLLHSFTAGDMKPAPLLLLPPWVPQDSLLSSFWLPSWVRAMRTGCKVLEQHVATPVFFFFVCV
jgi:hypothetical protein